MNLFQKLIYKSDLEKKKWWCWQEVLDTNGLWKKQDHNAKISDKIPGKIPSIRGLASIVENKIKIKYPTLMG